MITIDHSANLKPFNTFGISAECKCLITFTEEADLPNLYKEKILEDAIILGGGSNMLFVDADIKQTVCHPAVHFIHVKTLDDEGVTELSVGAGVALDDVCKDCCQLNIPLIASLSGIPGSMGGAVVQNAGAYGVEIGRYVDTITCFNRNSGVWEIISHDQCQFGYRSSIFKLRPELIITSVTLRFSNTEKPEFTYKALAEKMSQHGDNIYDGNIIRAEVLNMRANKLPHPNHIGSAGSMFKNPIVEESKYKAICQMSGMEIPAHIDKNGNYKLSAAWLIDHAGCKSFSAGGASLWQFQPLVLINTHGNATGQDVVNLEDKIKTAVSRKFGISIEPEVVHIYN